MSDTRTKPPRGEFTVDENPFGSSGNFGGQLAPRGVGDGGMSHPVAMPVGQRLDAAQAAVVTASRVAVKRDVPSIIRECREIATAKGPAMFYHWIVSKKDGTKETVEGPTVVAAMIAAHTYGNCAVSAMLGAETATHWIFAARFVDYEKGFTHETTFQQRKANLFGGKMGADRQLDLVYQIGQSKAKRNAVLGALRWLTDEMMDAAKDGILERIKSKPEAARGWLVKKFETLDIPIDLVERVVTRKVAQWLAMDMAKLMAQVTAIEEGFASSEDLYPSDARRAADAEENLAGQKPESRGEQEQQEQRQEEAQEEQRKPAPPADDTEGKARAARLAKERADGDAAAAKAAAAQKKLERENAKKALAEDEAKQKAAAEAAQAEADRGSGADQARTDPPDPGPQDDEGGEAADDSDDSVPEFN